MPFLSLESPKAQKLYSYFPFPNRDLIVLLIFRSNFNQGINDYF